MDSNSNPASKNLLPDVFELNLKCGVESRYYLRWVPQFKVLEFLYESVDSYGTKLKKVTHVKVTEKQWHIFWNAIDYLEAWDWRLSYTNGLRIDENTMAWYLKIKRKDNAIESFGFNAFPGDGVKGFKENKLFYFFVDVVQMISGEDDYY
jgi:hypothetical protein